MIFIIISTTLIGSTYLFEIPYLNPLIKLCSLVSFVLSFYYERWNNIDLKWVLSLLFLILIVSLNIDKTTFFIYGVALIAGRNENFKNICKITFFTNLICVLLIIILSLFGILQLEVLEHEGKTAFNFGFAYYSTLAFYTLFLSILGYYLYCNIKNKKSIIYTCLLIGIVNFIIYKLVTVRLTFICAMLLISLILIEDLFCGINKTKINKFVSLLMYPVAFISSMLLPFVYQWSEIGIRFNQLINSRLYLSKMAFERYYPRLFGNLIVTTGEGNNYFYLDSGYVYLLLGYGIVLTVLILSAYTLITYNGVKQKNSKSVVWSIVLCIFAFVNNPLMDIALNPLLFLAIPEFEEFFKNKSFIIRRKDK